MRSPKILLAVILLLAILAQGCSAIGIGKEEKKEITMKVLASSSDFAKYIPLLNEKFPHITFEVIDVYRQMIREGIETAKWDERLVEIIKEQKADFHMDMSPEYYIENYPLLDMAPLLTRDRVELSDILEQLTEDQIRSAGTLEVVSPTFDRNVLFVNRKLYRELGVAEPVSPMNWDEFRQSALAIQAKDPSVSGYKLNQPWFYAYNWIGEDLLGLESIANNQLMLNSAEWRELFEQLFEDTFKDTIKLQQTNLDNPVLINTGMFIGRASYLKNIINKNETPDDWAMMELPRNPSVTWSSSVYLSTPLSIYKESPYSDEAWEIVKFLISEEAAERLTADNLANGFVTYPKHIGAGEFPLEPLLVKGSSKPLSSVQLIQPSYQAVFDAYRTQFEAVASGILPFDQAWNVVDQKINEINANPDNFIEK